MNLLTKKSEVTNSDYFTVSNFRSAQYTLLNYFMNLCVEYISKQNKNYLKVNNIKIRDIVTYNGIHNNLHTSDSRCIIW